MKKVQFRVTVSVSSFEQQKYFKKMVDAAKFVEDAKKLLVNIPDKMKDFLIEIVDEN